MVSESQLIKRFGELSTSQQSVETLSLFLMHHRRQSQTIVHIWAKELGSASTDRKIGMIDLEFLRNEFAFFPSKHFFTLRMMLFNMISVKVEILSKIFFQCLHQLFNILLVKLMMQIFIKL
jgi:hypothetical protein